MSREDGMRYCYHTATFYLSMPGSQGRCARILEGLRETRQIGSSREGATGSKSWFEILAAIALSYYKV
jgi:hypothetical protein